MQNIGMRSIRLKIRSNDFNNIENSLIKSKCGNLAKSDAKWYI